MRILEVRLKNLNALMGSWRIDFTDPAYASSGIFAITGPTGAGKTTILDAICLALFGRTPRLGKIRSTNEIMTKHTSECSAQVTFLTQKGKYSCAWSQHRAKRSGALQAPRRVLTCESEARVIADSVSGVESEIEGIIGMDFDRFKKAMLLAQGDFAAFLQADAKDRAAVLEQITGTERYSQISMHVHKLWTEAETERKRSAEALGHIKILAPEELDALHRGMEAARAAVDAAAEEMAGLQAQIQWLDGLQALADEAAELTGQALEVAQRRQDFAPDLARLQRARQAESLGGAHAVLEGLRHSQAQDQRIREGLEAALPQREAAHAAAKAQLGQCEAALTARRDERSAAAPLHQQVRTLDLQAAERRPLRATAHAERVEAQAALRSLGESSVAQAARAAALREGLAHLARQQQACAADLGLIESFTGLKAELVRLDELRRRVHDAEVARLGAASAATTAQGQHAAAERAVVAAESTLAAATQACERSAAAIAVVLGGREPAAWRREREAALTRQGQWRDVQVASQASVRAEKKLQEIEAQRQENAQQCARHADAAALQAERAQLAQHEVNLCEQTLRLHQRIASFEEARGLLRDGEACPLCGALAHPFAVGNVPSAEADAVALERARQAAKEAHGAHQALLNLQQAAEQRGVHLAAQAEEERQALAEAQREVEAALVALELRCTPGEVLRMGHQWQAENAARLAAAEAVLSEWERCEAEAAAAAKTQAAAQTELLRATSAVAVADQQRRAAEQERERTDDAWEAARRAAEGAVAALETALAPYGVAAAALNDCDALIHSLAARRAAWRQREEDMQARQREVDALERAMHETQRDLSACTTLVEKLDVQLAAMDQDLEKLARERRALFQDRDVDREAQRLSAAEDAAVAALDQARALEKTASDAVLETRLQRDALVRGLDVRAAEIQEGESRFRERLDQAGFAAEADFMAARLGEASLAALTAQDEALRTAAAQLAARRRDLEEKTERERQKALCSDERAHVAASLLETTQRHQAHLEEAGALQQRLRDNAAQLNAQSAQREAHAALEREAAKWERLHKLIGSADGQKFRNFAQRLTFQQVVAHANAQLRAMCERYLLVQPQDPERPLDLDVLDHYQSGTTRTIKNLSGGETFLVSLALALGLAQMSSQNVQVDSLFLDEGFGSLDEEALDLALNTLASLHQSGKSIGVISHVAAMKDRIRERIEVVPLSGGRSRLVGPGCGAVLE